MKRLRVGDIAFRIPAEQKRGVANTWFTLGEQDEVIVALDPLVVEPDGHISAISIFKLNKRL